MPSFDNSLIAEKKLKFYLVFGFILILRKREWYYFYCKICRHLILKKDKMIKGFQLVLDPNLPDGKSSFER
jgi:hypothetical protein